MIERRRFLLLSARRGAGLLAAGALAPTLLAGCGDDEDSETSSPSSTQQGTQDSAGPRKIVEDVTDFTLASTDWSGHFGAVTMKLHTGVVDGAPVYYIRTDVSKQEIAQEEGLVFVPRLSGMVPAGIAASVFTFTNGASDQVNVLSTQPGREDYTPAWHMREVTWKGTPRLLESTADVEAAATAGDLTIKDTGVVMNCPVVKWGDGEMAVDSDLSATLGDGQLLRAPDLEKKTVTLKLHQCYPGSRYILTDVSLAGPAGNMKIAHSPQLAPAPDAQATARVNVFMPGLAGPGAMGGQPSVFDSKAGDPNWSPYWDHYTYKFKEGMDQRVFTTYDEILTAMDAGELDEWVGAPPTNGKLFTVNCPVPIVAPNDYDPAA